MEETDEIADFTKDGAGWQLWPVPGEDYACEADEREGPDECDEPAVWEADAFGPGADGLCSRFLCHPHMVAWSGRRDLTEPERGH